MTNVSATVRPRGACLAVTLEETSARDSAALVQEAALVASFAMHEIQSELNNVVAPAPMAGDLVLQTADPRDAASLAAWWSLAARLPASDTRMAVSLGLPPPTIASPRTATNLDSQVSDAQSAFRSALAPLAASWKRSQVESVSGVESGQGRFWILLANPCETSGEANAAAGTTAIAILASTHAYDGNSGVSLEPWLTPDGTGLVASAPARPDESPSALAHRVSNVVAAALLGPELPTHTIESVRRQVSTLLGAPQGPHGPGFYALAQALSPEQPALLAPFGTKDSILQTSPRNVALRRIALSSGPLRLAILANTSAQQAETAAKTVDRWIIHRSNARPTCPPIPTVAPVPSSTTANAVSTAGPRPHAWLGITVRNATASDALMLELLAETLRSPTGLLATTLRSSRVSAHHEVRTTGQQRLVALAIEFRGPDESLAPTLNQTASVLMRLHAGAVSESDLHQAYAAVETRHINQQMDPRVRLAHLWHQQPPFPPAPSLQEWKTWLSRHLSPQGIRTVHVQRSGARSE